MQKSRLSIGVAQRPAQGEEVCGDGYEIVDRPAGLLVAVVDGLGHGASAAEASAAFCKCVREDPAGDIEQLMRTADQRLMKTRGAAAALMELTPEQGRFEFIGVGNIDVQSVSKERIKPISLPGVVGGRIRTLKRFSYALHAGDLIAVFSDGISQSFDLRACSHLDVEEMAETIMRDHGKDRDDVTCVVVRFR